VPTDGKEHEKLRAAAANDKGAAPAAASKEDIIARNKVRPSEAICHFLFKLQSSPARV